MPALPPGANQPLPPSRSLQLTLSTSSGRADLVVLCVDGNGRADGDNGVALWTQPECAGGAVTIDPAAASAVIEPGRLADGIVAGAAGGAGRRGRRAVAVRLAERAGDRRRRRRGGAEHPVAAGASDGAAGRGLPPRLGLEGALPRRRLSGRTRAAARGPRHRDRRRAEAPPRRLRRRSPSRRPRSRRSASRRARSSCPATCASGCRCARRRSRTCCSSRASAISGPG